MFLFRVIHVVVPVVEIKIVVNGIFIHVYTVAQLYHIFFFMVCHTLNIPLMLREWNGSLLFHSDPKFVLLAGPFTPLCFLGAPECKEGVRAQRMNKKC